MSCTWTKPKRYSEEYFAKLTKDLQEDIQQNHLPKINSSALDLFVKSCKSLETAKTSLKEAQDLVSKLQNDGEGDDIIKAAQAVVDTCEETANSINDIVTISGSTILDGLDWAVQKGSDLETKLLRCTVLVQGTAKGLADWVDLDSDQNGKLIDEFLSNVDWMKQMIHGGGASKGNYGPAIEIHSKLLQALHDTGCCCSKLQHKLALAVALELCTPIPVFKQKDQFVDPISRFCHYSKAYDNGELDEAFDQFSVWELRFVVDSNATNEDLQWGRDYLKAYRPDEIVSQTDQWRYLWSVRSDVGYKHPDHEFNTYQELLSAGGECGPRAFFGRFICKAFGTPTWGVRQPGHAALSRWTPNRWLICLGAAFKFSSWEDNRYTGNNKSKTRPGVDFEEETKARMKSCESEYYKSLTTLECLAESMGETVLYDVDSTKPWRSLAFIQRRLFAARDSPNVNNQKQQDGRLQETPSAPSLCEEVTSLCTIHADDPKSMIIPATSYTDPAKPTKSVIPMMSYLGGGTQLHIEDGGEVTYSFPETIDVEGDFWMRCRIVNVHRMQVPLCLSFFAEKDDTDKDLLAAQHSIEIRYTGGGWQTTNPIKIQLTPGSKMKVTRQKGCHGLSIKDFLLEKC